MESAEGLLSRAFIGSTAGSEKIGDSDCRDDADDRDHDEQFDKREAFWPLFFSMCFRILLKRDLGF